MSLAIKTYLYELCHSSYCEKYIGFTTQYDETIRRWYDASVRQPQYISFMEDHGGLDSWNMRILKICDTREEAEVEKLLRVCSDSSYSLNKRGRPTFSRPFYHGVKKSSKPI